jgi:BRCA1-associated protein
LAREKQTTEKKLQNSNSKLMQSQIQLTEEKELRQALQLNQTSWQIKHNQLQVEMDDYKKKKEVETGDLREQIRDLMFFLEARNKIENSDEREEIASGRIVIGPGSQVPKPTTPKSKNKKDKKN